MSLAENKKAEARENDERVLNILVAAGDLGLQPGVLPKISGLPARTCREVVGRLGERGRGLVTRDGPRGRLRATMAGRSEARAGTPGVDLIPELEQAIDCFPTQAQRAYLRLLLSGIVVRHHLTDVYADGWGGFIVIGPTNTGKTALGAFACRVFGLPEPDVLRMLPDETPHSISHRRVQDKDGFRVVASPVLTLPFVVLDEWDKAEPEVRKAAGQLLMGRSKTSLEGQVVEIRPTVMLCLNPPQGAAGLDAVNDAYVRRSVVLDTTPLVALLKDIDDDMLRLFRRVPIPRLYLDQLRLPAQELSDQERRRLRDALRAGLNDKGAQLSDTEAVSRLPLGRAALLGDRDLERAVDATALDYLTIKALLDHTRPGFAAQLGARLGNQFRLAPNVAAAEEEQGRRQRIQAANERRDAGEAVEFEADRARRVAVLANALTPIARIRDPQARAIAAGLKAALRGVRGARTRPALEQAWLVAAEWLEQATRIQRAGNEAKASRARQREEERRRRAWERTSKIAAAKQERKARKQDLVGARVWRAKVIASGRGKTKGQFLAGMVELEQLKFEPGSLLKMRLACWRDGYGRRWREDQAPELLRSFYAWADQEVVRLGGKSKPLTIRLREDGLLREES